MRGGFPTRSLQFRGKFWPFSKADNASATGWCGGVTLGSTVQPKAHCSQIGSL